MSLGYGELFMLCFKPHINNILIKPYDKTFRFNQCRVWDNTKYKIYDIEIVQRTIGNEIFK